MIANAIFVTTVIFLALGIFVMQECQFLIPYRHVLFVRYGQAIALFAVALFVNLLAGVYMICRTFFLKDTGRKLAHLEKQLRTGDDLAGDLSRRLDD
ncbi:MAG: hypothetical protein C5B51_32320 [Terriglobia bacterium]|nr:MAG: hypothetical protein C5B51_32320 [Terriglobia bacterium]